MTTIAKAQVSVLNASYQPLSTTTLARAMALVIKGDAVIEESDETRIISSASSQPFYFPIVIRMLRMINVPFTVAPEYFSRRGVLKRDSFKCAYCLGPATTHDHIFPRSRGGKDEWMNCVAACTKCNGKKADRTPEEASMPLLFEPTIPQRIYLKSGKVPNRKPKKRK